MNLRTIHKSRFLNLYACNSDVHETETFSQNRELRPENLSDSLKFCLSFS